MRTRTVQCFLTCFKRTLFVFFHSSACICYWLLMDSKTL
uniref:Uncharacterized protein n=1 Tax=Anguilla anguilla TaxID=7936 RepID=A0A0E9R7B6_ANGAN